MRLTGIWIFPEYGTDIWTQKGNVAINYNQDSDSGSISDQYGSKISCNAKIPLWHFWFSLGGIKWSPFNGTWTQEGSVSVNMQLGAVGKIQYGNTVILQHMATHIWTNNIIPLLGIFAQPKGNATWLQIGDLDISMESSGTTQQGLCHYFDPCSVVAWCTHRTTSQGFTSKL